MFAKTPESLLGRLELSEANLGIYGTAVGATAQELTDVTEDRANLQFIIDYSDLVETNKSTVTKIKNAVYNGTQGEKVAALPVFPTDTPPFPLSAGIEDRFNKRAARWKTAAGYTPEIGVALGLIPATSGSPAPDSLQAALKLRDLGGYQYEAEFKKQEMSAMLIEYRVKGTEKWRESKTALTSPVMISVEPPSVEGAAVQLEVRCRLLKGNTPVGEWSPIYTLTVNP